MIKRYLKILLLALMLLPGIEFAQYQWTVDGIPIDTISTSLLDLSSIPDGNGGFFITYSDDPLGDSDIFAQWIDGSGNLRWDDSKTRVCTEGGDQKYPVISVDGSGGVFVAWQDEVNQKIYAKHLDSQGNLLQNITISSRASEQTDVQMISDGSGGVIVVWVDRLPGSKSDVYAQRFDHNGNSLWTTDGVIVTNAGDDQSYPRITEDGYGGVVVVWRDYRNGNFDIYAQRIDSNGNRLWNSDGVVICDTTGNQLSHSVELSGDKVIICWQDYRSGSSDIYAQAVSLNGNLLWDSNGIPISTASGTQMGCKVVEDGQGGGIIAWTDNRNFYDIYAQRVDGAGNVLWTENGIVVNQSDNLQYKPEMISDGNGGAYIVWYDKRSETNFDLYAQHIDGSGSLLWSVDGLAVVTADGDQQNHVLFSDGAGGFFSLWQDFRSSSNRIFAQHVNDNLSIINPPSGTLWPGGVSHTIEWEFYSQPTSFDHLSIHLSTAQGDDYPIEIAADVDPSQTSYDWTPNSINTNTARIKIIGLDPNDTVLCVYESDLFVIDSEPPKSFALLQPSDNDTVELRPTFSWQSTTDSLSGLDHYELWIGGVKLRDNLTDTVYTLNESEALTPGEYTWSVKAVDVAGLVRESGVNHFTAVVDATPPKPFNLISPADHSWTSDSSPVYVWESTSDSGSGLKKYQLFVDNKVKIDDIPPDDTTFSDLFLTSGDRQWYIVAVDSMGNTRKSSQSWVIRIDTQPPRPFSLICPGQYVWLNDATPRFQWEATSDTIIGIGLEKYELWIDGDLVVDQISGDSSSLVLPEDHALSDGIHTWYVVAKDSLGNARVSSNTLNLNIDTTPPEGFSLSSPGDGEYLTTISPQFSWESSSDQTSGLKSYRLWIDGSLNVDSLNQTSTVPAAPLTEGSHIWYVEAVDSAENVFQTQTFSFVADTSRPEPFLLVYPQNSDTIYTERPTFIWNSANDIVSGIAEYEIYVDGVLIKDNLSADDTSYTIGSSLENSTHTWRVRAIDRAGNHTYSDEYIFTINLNSPHITSPASVDAIEDSLFIYTATGTDSDGDSIIFSFENYPAWMNPDKNVISGIPVEGCQDTSFVVIATDGYLYDTLKVAVRVILINEPPVISAIPDQITNEDVATDAVAFTVEDEESPDSTLLISASSSDTLLIPDDNIIIAGNGKERTVTCIPAKDKFGSAVITIKLSDGELEVEESFNLTVNPVNDPPSITSPDSADSYEDSLFVYNATATDVDGPSLSIYFIDYPKWLTPSGSSISGIPLNGYQDTTFKVIATDSELSDTVVVVLNVNPVNDPPYFEFPLPKPVFMNIDSLNWKLYLDDYASDPDDPDSLLSWSYSVIDTHSVSVHIDEKSHEATISGVHLRGKIRIEFTVTDPHQESARDTLVINMIQTDVVENLSGDVPERFIFYNNYPNPFNPSTTIRYGLPRPCHVIVRIYNMLGQEVETLVDEKQREGTYEIVWDGSDQPSGIYFCHITAGRWQKVKRMILMK